MRGCIHRLVRHKRVVRDHTMLLSYLKLLLLTEGLIHIKVAFQDSLLEVVWFLWRFWRFFDGTLCSCYAGGLLIVQRATCWYRGSLTTD